MKVYRRGRSYRAIYDSGLEHIFLGLVPSRGLARSSPRMIAMPLIPDGTPPAVDPARVRRAVMRAIAELEADSGNAVSLEAIEYVPNDSQYYEKYYSLALDLGRLIIGGR